MKPRTIFGIGLVGAVIAFAGCAPNGGACSSFGNALMSGALAGMKQGMTGQDTENPCLTGGALPQAQPQQATSGQLPNPADLPKPSREELVRKYGTRHANLILQGNIDKGMDQDEVALAWGPPSGQSKDPHGGVVWEYGNDSVVFTRGKVSDVRHHD